MIYASPPVLSTPMRDRALTVLVRGFDARLIGERMRDAIRFARACAAPSEHGGQRAGRVAGELDAAAAASVKLIQLCKPYGRAELPPKMDPAAREADDHGRRWWCC